jgi:catechol 2,3-dioxygenase
MTANQGFVKPQRRPGELGVHSLDHLHFVVPDLTAAAAFYSDFGLDVGRKGDALTLGTGGHPHVWGTVGEGPRKKHQYMSFGAFEDDIDRFARRLQEMGIARLDPPAGVDSNGLWFHDHDGNLIEIAVAPKTSPNEKSVFEQRSAGPGVRGAPSRSAVERTYPRRLAHVLMFTRDVAKAIDFYSRVMGLRLSDHSGEGIAFMHGVHGSDHHMVAFGRSNAPGFHHLSWDVGSIDDIGRGAMHMLGKGYDKGWGLGRHVLGSNYFHYVRDPWGSYAEYSADIDFVPVDCDWKSDDHPPEDSFYVWGPNPPSDFVHNYEA